MESFLRQLSNDLIATSGWEWIAVALSVLYIYWAIRESLWCWPAAFLSTSIYSVLFFDVNLFMESALNVYYLVMAVYGWYQWKYKTRGEEQRPVIVWSLKAHIIIISGGFILVILSGLLLEKFTKQDFAFIDSFTTWFAVITTYMMAKKVLHHWVYWIFIDAVAVYLFINKSFALTALLFFGYTIMAVIGWLQWKKHFDNQTTT